MIPVFGDENAKDKFDDYIRSRISAVSGTQSANIDNGADVTTELFLYNRERGTIWGYNDEFISAPRLDDIQCAYSSVEAFVRAGNNQCTPYVNVCCIFNNEEVGSTTRQGADSTFCQTCLRE